MADMGLDNLPVGFRFCPSDEELVNHYLKDKLSGRVSRIEVIAELDICKFEPWDLPDKSIFKSHDQKWFFFSPRNLKYANGKRCNRATEAGYWKPTGKDRMIKSSSQGSGKIGSKKTLVFHIGRAPRGKKTNWIMHEYQADQNLVKDTNGSQDAYFLYKLFKKPEHKTENPSCDEVDPSGLSPATSKSFSDNILPMDTESREPVDVYKCLSKMADNETPDLPTETVTNCSDYMWGPDQDAAGSSIDPTFQSRDSNASLASEPIGNFGPSCDANAEQDDSSEDWVQWINFSYDEHPKEQTVEGVGDIGIVRRVRDDQDKTYPDTYPPQGNASRRIRLQKCVIQRCVSDSEDNEDDEEGIEARGIITEAVGAKCERFPEQVDQKYICSITRTHSPPKAKAALHQEDYGGLPWPNQSVKDSYSPNASSQRGIEKPGYNSRSRSKPKPRKSSVDKAPAASNTKTGSTVTCCLTLFIILAILVTAIPRIFIFW